MFMADQERVDKHLELTRTFTALVLKLVAAVSLSCI
jgi:hypothetical protein